VENAQPDDRPLDLLHKVAERITQLTRQRPRDGHDFYRLLREIDRVIFVAGKRI